MKSSRQLKVIFGFIVSIFGFIVSGNSAWAETALHISAKVDGFIHTENAAPGDAFQKTISLRNAGDIPADFFLTLPHTTASDFAHQVHFFLRDKQTGRYFIGGNGDRFTLRSLRDAHNVFVTRLEAGESKQMEMIFAVDTSLGNEFQGKQATFHLRYGLSAESGAGAAPYRGQLSRSGTGVSPEDAGILPQKITSLDEEDVKGVMSQSDDIVAGARPCSEWKWWQWSLLVGIFVLGWFLGRKVPVYVAGRRGVFWKSLWLASALVLWFELDGCRSALWVPFFLVLAGALLWREKK